MRSQRLVVSISVLSLLVVSLYYLRINTPAIGLQPTEDNVPVVDQQLEPEITIPSTSPAQEPTVVEKPEPLKEEKQGEPFRLDNEHHPIWQLIKDAEQKVQRSQDSQSKTLEEAVTEYRRRYGIPPPPHFDKWYAFARAREVVFIDEFDGIHKSLTPFWGLKPSTIRARAKEALGGNNNLLGILTRDGKIANTLGGREWMQKALSGMMKKFVKFLPDMDLCFNIHDEPRIIIPQDDLHKLMTTALKERMPAAKAVPSPRNSWSERPPEIGDGSRVEDTMLTRFNVFAHQTVWSHSRMSCPLDSPARDLEDGPKKDNDETYAVNELGFIYNQTAFSDICQSPSVSESYGFFAGPNAMNIAHDLFPIFSQSKISSYADILYPSPWYWAEKVFYNETLDKPWEEKKDDIYWRGSTTGGYSRNGRWRRQHRQRFVQKINAGDNAKIMVNGGGKQNMPHEVEEDPVSPVEEDSGDRPAAEESKDVLIEAESGSGSVGKGIGKGPTEADSTTRPTEEAPAHQHTEEAQINRPVEGDINFEAREPRGNSLEEILVRRQAEEATFDPHAEASVSRQEGAAGNPSKEEKASSKEEWYVKSIPRSDIKGTFDIHFSHVGQCDPGDCDAQREFFDVKERADPEEAWAHKYLLDIDGNAFSGRFYAFLKSNSLIYKLAIFREWHDEWLKPWVHFVPLSLKGEEWLEAVRYFSKEKTGQEQAKRIARQGQVWANAMLRNEDMEVWFFRLLLEYGRLVDNDREIIGYR